MSQPTISKTILCEKCKSPLWTFKILSYFEGKTHADAVVGATEWKSANPLVLTDNPGKDVNCPICKRPFMQTQPRTGRLQILMVDETSKRASREWL